MKKIFVLLSLFIVLIGIVQIIYFERYAFTQKYDEEYWRDRFEHSQWVLPLSKRIIGDDGLYAYIGYRLVHGYSLDAFDAEVPPLGKYFIGLSILIFDNPSYYALFFGLGSMLFFYLIAKRVLNNSIGVHLVVSLLFLDPLFFSQFWKSTLDICQLFFLLMHILFFYNLINSRENDARKYILYALVIGFSLGLFSQVKYPLLLPIIFVSESLYFLFKKMKKVYLVYLISILLAILIVNIKFFLDGNSLINFLNLQKYMFSFYLKSQLVAHKEAIWQTLFLGIFPEISNRNLISIKEWWIMWPVAAIIALPSSLIAIFKKNGSLSWQGFGILLLGGLILYTFIPSYPRYLLIVLPFIYLFFVKTLLNIHNINLKFKYVLIVVILFYGLVNMNIFLKDKPSSLLDNFYYNFTHQYFQDIYQENLVEKNRDLISREKFRFIAQKAFDDAGIKAINIERLDENIHKDKGNVNVKITYYTQNLGIFSEIKDLALRREEGKWKIEWNWNLVFNGFLTDYTIETERIIGKRGKIIDSNGKILGQDSEGFLISVNPEKIDLRREQEMLKLIGTLGRVETPHLQNAYLENSLPEKYIPLTTLFVPFEEASKKKLLSFPGVRLTPYSARIYNGIDDLSIKNTVFEECCTRIYSSYSYHGIKGLEEEHDLSLLGHDGGSIRIKNKIGKVVRTILEKKAKNGQDISVPL